MTKYLFHESYVKILIFKIYTAYYLFYRRSYYNSKKNSAQKKFKFGAATSTYWHKKDEFLFRRNSVVHQQLHDINYIAAEDGDDSCH